MCWWTWFKVTYDYTTTTCTHAATHHQDFLAGTQNRQAQNWRYWRGGMGGGAARWRFWNRAFSDMGLLQLAGAFNLHSPGRRCCVFAANTLRLPAALGCEHDISRLPLLTLPALAFYTTPAYHHYHLHLVRTLRYAAYFAPCLPCCYILPDYRGYLPGRVDATAGGEGSKRRLARWRTTGRLTCKNAMPLPYSIYGRVRGLTPHHRHLARQPRHWRLLRFLRLQPLYRTSPLIHHQLLIMTTFSNLSRNCIYRYICTHAFAHATAPATLRAAAHCSARLTYILLLLSCNLFRHLINEPF